MNKINWNKHLDPQIWVKISLVHSSQQISAKAVTKCRTQECGIFTYRNLHTLIYYTFPYLTISNTSSHSCLRRCGAFPRYRLKILCGRKESIYYWEWNKTADSHQCLVINKFSNVVATIINRVNWKIKRVNFLLFSKCLNIPLEKVAYW